MNRIVFMILVTIIALPIMVVGIACEENAPGNIVDDLGRTVSVDETPERIVSLAPSITEILYALDLEDRIVGVTSYCDYPDAAASKPKVGGFSTVDLEAVAAADPDVVFAANIHKSETIPALEDLGYVVITLAPETIDDVLDNIALVGDITGESQSANTLISDMTARIKAISDVTGDLSQSQMPHTLYVTWHDPIYTVGSGTLTQDLIEKAGGINVAHDISGHGVISLESAVARNPGVVIACTGHGSSEDEPFEWALYSEVLSTIDARETNNVYQVDADQATRGGPRIIEGLEWFAYFLHPDLFDAPA
ncbi:MAG: ABC transporter substrate-binding protein [Chloroflexota bacterium]|nr:ABC transporter substrate-binding protein [Chloroflexota bacterium]